MSEKPHASLCVQLSKKWDSDENKSLYSGLMFCFRIVQGYTEIFP